MKNLLLLFISIIATINLSGQILEYPITTSQVNDEITFVRSNDSKLIFDARSSEHGYDLFIYDIAGDKITPLNIDPCKNNTSRVVALEVFEQEAYAMISDDRWAWYVKIDLLTYKSVILRKFSNRASPSFATELYFIQTHKIFYKLGDSIYFVFQYYFNESEIWITDGTTNGTSLITKVNFKCDFIPQIWTLDFNLIFDMDATSEYLYFTAGMAKCGNLYRYNFDQEILENITIADSSTIEGVSNLVIYNNQPYFSTYPNDQSIWTIDEASSSLTKVTEQSDLRSTRNFTIVNDNILIMNYDMLRSINLNDGTISFERKVGRHRGTSGFNYKTDIFLAHEDQSFAYVILMDRIIKTNGTISGTSFFSHYDSNPSSDGDDIHARLIPGGLSILNYGMHIIRGNFNYRFFTELYGAVSGDIFYSNRNLVAHDLITRDTNSIVKLNHDIKVNMSSLIIGQIDKNILFTKSDPSYYNNRKILVYNTLERNLDSTLLKHDDRYGFQSGNLINDKFYFRRDSQLISTTGTEEKTDSVAIIDPYNAISITGIVENELFIGTELDLYIINDLNDKASIAKGDFSRMFAPRFSMEGSNDLRIFHANNSLYKLSDDLTQASILLADITMWDFNSSQYFDGILYFGGTTVTGGDQLWRTDGTTAGTYAVFDNFRYLYYKRSPITSTDQGIYFINEGNLYFYTPSIDEPELIPYPSDHLNFGSATFELLNFRDEIFILLDYQEHAIVFKLDKASNELDELQIPRLHEIEAFEVMDKATIIFVIDSPKEGKELWYYNSKLNKLDRIFDLDKGTEDGISSSIEIIDNEVYFLGKSSPSNAGIWKYTYVDSDEDGYPVPLDCDDQDENIYPGTGNCAAIVKPKSENDLHVYPNPTSGIIYLEFRTWSERIIRFRSPFGQILVEIDDTISPQIQIDVSSYPTGQYYLDVFDQVTNERTTKAVQIFNN